MQNYDKDCCTCVYALGSFAVLVRSRNTNYIYARPGAEGSDSSGEEEWESQWRLLLGRSVLGKRSVMPTAKTYSFTAVDTC